MSEYIEVASSWHGARASFGATGGGGKDMLAYAARIRIQHLNHLDDKLKHAVHSETIPWQHLHTLTEKQRN